MPCIPTNALLASIAALMFISIVEVEGSIGYIWTEVKTAFDLKDHLSKVGLLISLPIDLESAVICRTDLPGVIEKCANVKKDVFSRLAQVNLVVLQRC
jgi:hypothetical protein